MKILWTTQIFCAVMAAPVLGADMQREIDHLMQFVENTECQYERNGKFHTGKEAAEHIRN